MGNQEKGGLEGEHRWVDGGALLTETGRPRRVGFGKGIKRLGLGSFHLRFLLDNHVKVDTSLRLGLEVAKPRHQSAACQERGRAAGGERRADGRGVELHRPLPVAHVTA